MHDVRPEGDLYIDNSYYGYWEEMDCRNYLQSSDPLGLLEDEDKGSSMLRRDCNTYKNCGGNADTDRIDGGGCGNSTDAGLKAALVLDEQELPF